MSKDEIIIICFALSLVLVLICVLGMTDSLRYYKLKPKYRINKETRFVEYWQPMTHTWNKVCGWDKEDSDRKVILYLSGNQLEFRYKGPGRYVYTINGNPTQKEFRERFPYKTTKELHEQQLEYINNEDIITSKNIYEKLNIKLINNS